MNKRKPHKRACQKITAEHIQDVREVERRFPNATNAEIAKLCGLGKSTVEGIKRGKYDSIILGDRFPKLTKDDMMLCPLNGMAECNVKCAFFMANNFNQGRCAVSVIAHNSNDQDNGRCLVVPANCVPYNAYGE